MYESRLLSFGTAGSKDRLSFLHNERIRGKIILINMILEDDEMKIIENFETTSNIEKLKEFDAKKTKVFKYIMYKKRTEQEVRKKFKGQIEEQMLDEIIEYLKEAKYLDDYEFIEKQVREYMNLKTLSIKEIKYKLLSKGLDRKLIEKYIDSNYEELDEYEKECIEKIKTKKSDQTEEEIRQYLYRKGYKID